jgi:hypothetical protein
MLFYWAVHRQELQSNKSSLLFSLAALQFASNRAEVRLERRKKAMSSAAQQQQKAAAAEQEEVEHGPFPIEQLQVRTRLPSPCSNPNRLLGSGSCSPRARMGGFSAT